MKLNDNILPWETSKDSGFTKLDLHLILTPEFRLDVRRQKPKEQQPGNFAVYKNGVRISERTHAQRPDAIAEAERFFYSLEQNRASNTATALNVIIENGKQAFRNGQSVYANPHQKTSVDHAQWAAGWLQESTAGLANAIVKRFEESAVQSGRAVEQMNHDLEIVSARLQAWVMVFDYAEILADAGPGGIEQTRLNKTGPSAQTALEFLRDFRSGDTDLMSKKWPGWSQFLYDKKLGPPPDTDPPGDDGNSD